LPELQELPVALGTAIRVPSELETCTHDGRRTGAGLCRLADI